mmetsp:Transcript_57412/g.136455  ORF Transcript_57412/g.136455 Transcript_57412/m.136455 type:complete len:216 (-) Transcript_57412:706-1353(-)
MSLWQRQSDFPRRRGDPVLALVHFDCAEQRVYAQPILLRSCAQLHIEGLQVEADMQGAGLSKSFIVYLLRELYVNLHLLTLICEGIILDVLKAFLPNGLRCCLQLPGQYRLRILGIAWRHPRNGADAILKLVLPRGYLHELGVTRLHAHPCLGNSIYSSIGAIHRQLQQSPHLPRLVLVDVRLMAGLLDNVVCTLLGELPFSDPVVRVGFVVKEL